MKEKLIFQHYLTAYIDLLGQKDELKKINKIPDNSTEEEEFKKCISESVLKVIHFRNTFDDYFTSAKSHTPNTSLVSPAHWDEFIASQKSEVIYNGVSDSFIISVPLMNSDENCTAINGVFASFIALCGIGLSYLSQGIPIRAGLDVGIGTLIEENEVYGASLERAYYMENCLAEYPRYLVGEELINYLMFVMNQKPRTNLGRIAKGLAGKCKEMIIQDTDGRYMLDFLGNAFRENISEAIDKDTITNAEKFILSMYKKFLKEKNQKLSLRYYRLMSYFNSQKKNWVIT